MGSDSFNNLKRLYPPAPSQLAQMDLLQYVMEIPKMSIEAFLNPDLPIEQSIRLSQKAKYRAALLYSPSLLLVQRTDVPSYHLGVGTKSTPRPFLLSAIRRSVELSSMQIPC
jgi:hypothetical protein